MNGLPNNLLFARHYIKTILSSYASVVLAIRLAVVLFSHLFSDFAKFLTRF